MNKTPVRQASIMTPVFQAQTDKTQTLAISLKFLFIFRIFKHCAYSSCSRLPSIKHKLSLVILISQFVIRVFSLVWYINITIYCYAFWIPKWQTVNSVNSYHLLIFLVNQCKTLGMRCQRHLNPGLRDCQEQGGGSQAAIFTAATSHHSVWNVLWSCPALLPFLLMRSDSWMHSCGSSTANLWITGAVWGTALMHAVLLPSKWHSST